MPKTIEQVREYLKREINQLEIDLNSPKSKTHFDAIFYHQEAFQHLLDYIDSEESPEIKEMQAPFYQPDNLHPPIKCKHGTILYGVCGNCVKEQEETP